MILHLTHEKNIGDVQHEFNQAYPYLKIEFYKKSDKSSEAYFRKHLPISTPIKSAGLTKNGNLEMNDAMSVGRLEKSFYEIFGLQAQVSRKSGRLWLETTMTDSWTLKQQNDHGRDLSAPEKSPITIYNENENDNSG